MAGTDGSALKREEIWCEDIYTGTADQIVAAGLLRAEQLPGQPGGPKCQATFYRGEPSSRRGSAGTPCDEHRVVVRRLSTTRFEISVGVSKSEQEARKSKALARRVTEQQLQVTEQQRQLRANVLRDQIRMAAKDEAAFRSNVVEVVQCLAKPIVRGMQPKGSAFRFTSAAVDEIRACLNDCIGRLQHLPVAHDGAAFHSGAAELAALEDESFQAALDVIRSGATAADDARRDDRTGDAPDSEFGTKGWVSLFGRSPSEPGEGSPP